MNNKQEQEFESKINKRIEKIIDNDSNKEQRKTLKKWHEEHKNIMAFSTRLGRIKFYIYFGKFLKKPFEEATTEDILKYLNSSKFNQSSKRTLAQVLKKLYDWLEMPKIAEYIVSQTPQRVKPKEILSKDCLNQEDVERMIKVGNNYRDKALISVLSESGCRASELLSSNIGDVEFNDNERIAILIIKNGKNRSGTRSLLLYQSYPYLKDWLNDYPLEKKKESPLFIGYKKYFGKRLNYSGLYKIVYNLAEKSGIKKRVNPHWFRHSRATQMAGVLKDAELRVFLGHERNSMLIGRYTHTSSEDVIEKIKESNGINPKEKKEETDIKSCPKCKVDIDFNKNKFCSNCGAPLSKETAVEGYTKREMAEKLMDKLLAKLLEKEKNKDYIYKILKEMGLTEDIKKF